MQKHVIPFTLAWLFLGSAAQAQLAITETMSSASTNLGPTTVVAGPDYWELTNFGTNTIDLTGYIFNDADATRGGDADSTTLSGISIGPGESIILVQTGTTVVSNRADFINWWGAPNVPANLQVLFYANNGQSSGGDSIVLWAPTAASDDDYVDRADFGEAVRGHSFTYNATNGAFGIISSNGIGGSFKAVTSDDEGSPGKTSGAVALKITQQPTPSLLTVPADTPTTLTAAAQGLPRPRYQWRHNGTNLPAATQATLSLSDPQLTDAGTYSVIVSNGVQSLVSSNSLLTVTTTPVLPEFTLQPASADAFIGQTVRFNSQVAGSPTPFVQWTKNGNAISGETGAQLTLFNVQSNDAAIYAVVASNSAGTNSVSATLTVGPKPRLLITEVHPSGSSESGHADWWELTSFDTRIFNLKGWRWDDSSQSVAPGTAYVFLNDVIIHPGETAIFVEGMTPAAFRTWWGAGLPSGVQIFSYSGSNLGLSTTSDAVNLWNAVTLVGNELTERVCGINFGASTSGWTFVYDPENPPLAGVFNVASTNTAAGNIANAVYSATVLGAFGSPGYVIAPVYVTSQVTGSVVRLTWNSAVNRGYVVEYKEDLTAGSWLALSNLTATASSTTITTTNGTPGRYYRVAAQVPLVSEP